MEKGRIGKVAALVLVAAACFGLWRLLSGPAVAHCDTLDGPVVMDAKKALEKGDIAPVLKWVKKEREGEVREAFKKTLAVRAKLPEAKDLADLYFFETLVRLHRAGEGAPYTGLKPAGNVEPIVAAADKALESGSAEDLAKEIAAKAAEGIRDRLAKAIEKKKHAEESVEAGREFVESYVEYVHYVERLHVAATTGAAHGEAGEDAGHGHGEGAKAPAEHRLQPEKPAAEHRH